MKINQYVRSGAQTVEPFTNAVEINVAAAVRTQ
jgi:hypothetical protein